MSAVRVSSDRLHCWQGAGDTAGMCGLVFGFALHKAGVYRAAFIIQQFQFTNFRMLKVRVGWGWNGCWPFDTTCLPP